jgi:putative aldouronate transport system substrate-binding protein
MILCAACSGGQAPTASPATPAPVSSSSEGESSASDPGLPEVTLHFIFFDGKKSATDEVWTAIGDKFKNEFNAKFDVQFIAGTDYKDRMLVKQGAGDKWDLNFEGEWLSYFQMINMNAYMGLNDLLPQYAPDLYNVYQDSGVLKAATSKGQIVALPWTNVMSTRPFFQWRGDLDDTDPASIKTIEDIEKLLYSLKEKYPDKYIIENAGLDLFKLKYDQVTLAHNFVFDARASKVEIHHVTETPSYLERAEYAYKWQNDGLIWADVLVDQLDHNQLINQGQLITKFGTFEYSRSARAWVEPSAFWAYNHLYEDKMWANRTPLANIVAIPRTAENPERTLMFLNLLETSQELYDMVHYGIEGKTYVMQDDFVAFPEGMNAANSNYQLWQGRWALFKPQFMRPDSEYAKDFWKEEKDFAESNPNNFVSPLEGFSFDTEPVTTEIAQISQLYDAAEKMLDVGLAGEPSAVVAELQTALKNAGLDKVKAEFQRQIDAFLAL